MSIMCVSLSHDPPILHKRLQKPPGKRKRLIQTQKTSFEVLASLKLCSPSNRHKVAFLMSLFGESTLTTNTRSMNKRNETPKSVVCQSIETAVQVPPKERNKSPLPCLQRKAFLRVFEVCKCGSCEQVHILCCMTAERLHDTSTITTRNCTCKAAHVVRWILCTNKSAGFCTVQNNMGFIRLSP